MIQCSFGSNARIRLCQGHKARKTSLRGCPRVAATVRRRLRQAWELDADKVDKLIRNLAKRLEREASAGRDRALASSRIDGGRLPSLGPVGNIRPMSEAKSVRRHCAHRSMPLDLAGLQFTALDGELRAALS